MVVRKIRKKVRRRGALARLHEKNPDPKKKGSEREMLWREYLKEKTPEQRRRLAAARKRIEAGRRKILKKVEAAVGGLRKKYPYFKGILIFRSIAKGSSKPGDIDYIKVFDFSQKLTQRQVNGITEMTSVQGPVETVLRKATGLEPEPFERIVSVVDEHAMAATFGVIKRKMEELDSPAQRQRPDYDPFELHSWNFVGDARTRQVIARALREKP